MAIQPNRAGQVPAQVTNKQLQPQSAQQPALSTEPTVVQPVMIPGAGAVTGITISKTPRPLNGTELSAVAVYQIAAALAQQFSQNGRLSDIAAFAKHKVRFQILCEITNPTDKTDTIWLQAAKDFELDLAQTNVDYLRAEAGIGLWHEGRSISNGTVVEFRQQPSRQVLEHLKSIGPELVKPDNAELGGLDLMISGLGGR